MNPLVPYLSLAASFSCHGDYSKRAFSYYSGIRVQGMQSQKAGWQNRTVFQHRRCLGVRSFSSVFRYCGNLAIHCQEETKAMAFAHSMPRR